MKKREKPEIKDRVNLYVDANLKHKIKIAASKCGLNVMSYIRMVLTEKLNG